MARTVIPSARTAISTEHFAIRDYPNALLFNGGNLPDARITNFDPTGSSGQFMTAAMWYKQQGQNLNGVFFSQFDYGVSPGQRSWNLGINNNNWRVNVSDTGAGNTKRYDSPSPVTDGAWHLFVITWDNGTLKLYKDGAEITPSKVIDGAMTTLHASTADVMIGSQLSNNNDADKADGFTGPCWLWSDVLSAVEISDLYYNAVVPQDNLELEILFGEGSGTSVADTSGNSRNATISAPDWQTGPFAARTVIPSARTAIS